MELLCEMNGDVKGHAKVANFQNMFQTGDEISMHSSYYVY